MCGLIGYCGSKPANPNYIKILMMYNEDRGSDAAGWVVNNRISKDAVKVSKFLAQNPLELSESDENYTIIAHARKASSGSHFSKELAHPFGMYSGATEKAKYDLVLAMNGTITNYKEIAEKWDFDFKERENSDTQLIAKVMAKLGPKEFKLPLEAYTGSATLLFFTPKNNNTLMVFRDSLRELYYWQKEEDEIYISSIEESLHTLGAGKLDTKPFTSQHLYKIVKGKIVHDELIASKPIPINSYKKNIGGRHSYYYGDEYAGYGGGVMAQGMGAAHRAKTSSYTPVKILRPDPCLPQAHTDKKGIYVTGDKYFRTGHPVTGQFFLTDEGDVVSTEDTNTRECKSYYFINGYMCKDGKSYDELIAKVSDEKGYQLNKFKMILTSEMVEYFMYPAVIIVGGNECWVLNDRYGKKGELNRGDTIEIDMFLSEYIIIVRYEGEITRRTEKLVVREQMSTLKPKKVNTKSDIDRIEEFCPRERSIIFLKNQLAYVAGMDSSDSLHLRITTDLWKVNSRREIKEYFYTMLLEMMLNDNVILKEKFEELTEQGNKQLWAGSEFIDSMDEAILLYKAKIRDNVNNKSKVDDEDKEISPNLSISGMPEDKIVKSIQERNPVYKMSLFSDAVCDIKYNNLDNLGLTFVKEADPKHINWRYFYEAVLLVLNTCGKIGDNELIFVIEQDFDELKKKAEEVYEEWYSIFAVSSNSDEDVSDVVVENWGEEDVEKSFKEQLSELIGQMRDVVEQGEITREEIKLISPRTEKIIAIVRDTMFFIEKRVKEDKLLEK